MIGDFKDIRLLERDEVGGAAVLNPALSMLRGLRSCSERLSASVGGDGGLVLDFDESGLSDMELTQGNGGCSVSLSNDIGVSIPSGRAVSLPWDFSFQRGPYNPGGLSSISRFAGMDSPRWGIALEDIPVGGAGRVLLEGVLRQPLEEPYTIDDWGSVPGAALPRTHLASSTSSTSDPALSGLLTLVEYHPSGSLTTARLIGMADGRPVYHLHQLEDWSGPFRCYLSKPEGLATVCNGYPGSTSAGTAYANGRPYTVANASYALSGAGGSLSLYLHPVVSGGSVTGIEIALNSQSSGDLHFATVHDSPEPYVVYEGHGPFSLFVRGAYPFE